MMRSEIDTKQLTRILVRTYELHNSHILLVARGTLVGSIVYWAWALRTTAAASTAAEDLKEGIVFWKRVLGRQRKGETEVSGRYVPERYWKQRSVS